MDLSVALPQFMAFLLAMARVTAWLVVSPPFNSRAVPGTIKALLGAAIALPLTPTLVDQTVGMSTGAFLVAVVVQILAGVALGFVTYVLFAALEAAGNIMDLSIGFSAATSFDPMSANQNSPLGRLHQMLAVVLMLTTGAYLMVFAGLFRSFEALPLDGSIAMNVTAATIAEAVTTFFIAAVQIAAPVIGVMFVTDVALALLNRVAPAMNIFTLGFSVKMLVGMVVVTFTVAVLPGVVNEISRHAAEAMMTISEGSGTAGSGASGAQP